MSRASVSAAPVSSPQAAPPVNPSSHSKLLTAAERALVNECFRLTCELQADKPKEKRLKQVKDLIAGWYPELGPDQTAVAPGDGCEVQIGARSIEKEWANLQDVQKAVGGWNILRAICTVTFKAVAGKIGNERAAALQVERQSGHRKVEAVAVVDMPCQRVHMDLPPKAA